MIGARPADNAVLYPVSATAARHGASVERETTSPREASAGGPGPFTPCRAPWPQP
jgi:hypothetical protein